MDWPLVMLALVSGSSFLFYGHGTLFTMGQRDEFERYGMPRLRVLVGSTQLLGAAGVVLGLAFPVLGVVAASGLTLMMFFGLMVRFRIHDAVRLMVPAASLAVLNATLAVLFLVR